MRQTSARDHVMDHLKWQEQTQMALSECKEGQFWRQSMSDIWNLTENDKYLCTCFEQKNAHLVLKPWRQMQHARASATVQDSSITGMSAHDPSGHKQPDQLWVSRQMQQSHAATIMEDKYCNDSSLIQFWAEVKAREPKMGVCSMQEQWQPC